MGYFIRLKKRKMYNLYLGLMRYSEWRRGKKDRQNIRKRKMEEESGAQT